MANQIYTGVILYFKDNSKILLETCMCFAEHGDAARADVKTFAEDFAGKHKIAYQKMEIVAQRQDESEIRQLLYFARVKFSEMGNAPKKSVANSFRF